MFSTLLQPQFAALIIICTASISIAGFCPGGTVTTPVWQWTCQIGSRQCYWKAVIVNTTTAAPNVCCTSYNGTNCDIPICSPKCTWTTGVKTVCSSPNNCFPLGWGDNIVTCSSPNYCFPGLCSADAPVCRCAAGFTGTNCATIQQAPTMASCSLVVRANGVQLQSGNCQTNNSLVFSRSDLSGLTLSTSWVSELLQTVPNTNAGPPYPNYISDGQGDPSTYWNVGIAQTSGSVTLIDPFGTSQTTKPLACSTVIGDTPTTPPKSSVPCNPTISFDSNLASNAVGHGSTLSISITSQAGGFVWVAFTTPTARNFNRNTATYQTTVVIDDHRPSHCSENQTCTLTDQPPIFHSDNDFSKVSLHNLGVFGWNDLDVARTGLTTTINSYTFTACPMVMNSTTGLLTEVTSCLTSTPAVYSLKSPGSLPSITLTQSAMYSLQAAVCDRAANCARSRKLIFYDNSNNIQIVTSSPMYVSDGGSTSYTSHLSGTLKLWWTGHFVNELHRTMLKGVREGQPGEFIFDATHGTSTAAVRTLDPIPNMDGIISFAVAVAGGPLQPVTGGQQSANITIPSGHTQGDSFTVTVQAIDILNNTRQDTFTIYFDLSLPTFVGSDADSIQLEINIEDPPAELTGLDVSRVRVFAKDNTSGIHSLVLTVYDVSEGITLPVNLNQSVFTVSPLPTASCAADTGSLTTYTTVGGACLSINQSAYIRHCDLYKRDSYILVIQVTIINGAGLTVTRNLTTQQLTTLRNNKNCQPTPPTTPYTTPSFNNTTNNTTTSGGGLSGGAIAGIVIGCVVGVALIALLIVLLWCYCFKRTSSDKGYEAGPRRADGTAAVVTSPSAPAVLVVDKSAKYDQEKSIYDKPYDKLKTPDAKFEQDASGEVRYVTR